MSSTAGLMLCLLIAAGVITAASSTAILVLCLLITAGVATTISFITVLMAGSLTLKDMPTSISISALDLLIVVSFLIVLFIDLDFYFLL
jgi:hypothetical protein